MNLIYFLGSFPRLSQSFVLNEIYELKQKGHNVAVCALRNPDEGIVHKEFNELNIPIYYIGTPTLRDAPELFSSKSLHPRIIKNTLYRASPQNHAANLYRAKKCIEFIESLDWEPDHVHSHFASLSRFAGLYVARYHSIPFTITIHAYDIYRKPIGSYTGSLLRNADRIVTISDYNKSYLRNKFALETPIDIVRAGIRPEKFSPTKTTEPFRVLTVSRFVEKKGLSYALEAISLAAETTPEIEYHLIGSGELENTLRSQVKQLGIEDNVTFLHNVTDEQLIAELDAARCFLLPCVIAESGDRDGIPVALMEAMAIKTPPISTTVSGIPELIDHEQNGLLTEPRDPKATGNAIVSLLKNENKWKAYATSARKKVEVEFNIEKEAEKLESVFQRARFENREGR